MNQITQATQAGKIAASVIAEPFDSVTVRGESLTAVSYGEGGKAIAVEADSAATCYGSESWAIARGDYSSATAFGIGSKAECYGRDSRAIVGDIGWAVAHRPCGQLMGGAGAELRWVMPDSPNGDIVVEVGKGGIAPSTMYHLLDGRPVRLNR